MKRALVLSGGGARGSYQIGVWKAFRELGINFDIITGTSVGALNGAMIVQDSYELAENFWYDTDYSDVFNDKFFRNKRTLKKPFKIIRRFAEAALKEKGLDVSVLEKNIDLVLDEEAFYNSSIDYGLITYDLADRKPLMLKKDEIPQNKLKDFMVASATVFPFFKKKKIANKYYVDGAFYDNLPINLAIDMGATEIIAVDILPFWIRKSIKKKNVNIVYIVPKSSLGFPLFFDKELARRGMRLGYNDAMKIFGNNEGHFYTFEKNNVTEYYKQYKKEIEKNIKRSIRITDFLVAIEYLGILFDIDESYIYNIGEFNNMLINYIKKHCSNYTIKDIYHHLTNLENDTNQRKLSLLLTSHSRKVLSSIYLYILTK